MISFDKIVNKLLKKWWKIIFKEDIFDLIDPEKKPQYNTLVNKTIYRLKSIWVLKVIRNWVYVISNKDDNELNEIDLVEKYYFELVKKYILQEVWSDYFISWKKSLEIHLKNYSIPEKIIIITRKTNKKIIIWNYQIIFKTISQNGKNLYSKFSKLTKSIFIDKTPFKISCLELSLVESALISDSFEWIYIDDISKVLKKYGKFFIIENFYLIWELKYIMAFNRLKEISRPINNNLYQVFLDIIKKNWGLFIWEWLRRI